MPGMSDDNKRLAAWVGAFVAARCVEWVAVQRLATIK